MKMLIFLVVFALVAYVVLQKVRKADAEKDLARQKAMNLKKKERQKAIMPKHHGEFPVAILPAGKERVKKDEELPEPTMSTIEFKPVDHPSLQH